MNNHNKYNTQSRERKVFAIAMLAVLVAILIWGVMELCGVFSQDTYTPDIEIPMTNTQVSWSQTFKAGAWGDAQ